ncbi:zinc finger protein ZAT12-like [Zingiber officinale]|uniref:zinc finger protein ZAT12-like n=1 Tax=Zingiber officinale TaxID=94328 RepID=UPI001C4D828C|nr:zinc finger protein ZAT12-like [Zingiber officinale]
MAIVSSLKRSRDQEEVEGAELLLMLSLSGGVKLRAAHAQAEEKGEFECKTCSRRFATFQALGGHRTSHKRARVERPEAAKESSSLHRCGVCGVEFALGQALGGHMRRHRVMAAAAEKDRPVGEYGRRHEENKTNAGCIEFDELVGMRRSSSQFQLLPLFV